MTSKATEKIIDALTQLVEGFAELQESLEDDFKPGSDSDDEDDSDEESEGDIEDALVTEIRAAVEAVIENEDCAPEDLASIVSALTGALEEIDPEVFADDESSDDDEEEEDDDEEEYDEDDDDMDLDDDDEEYDEDEEDEDEEEEEYEDDDEEEE